MKKTNPKPCAYCNRTVSLTKEHVVNKSFVEKFYKTGKGYANNKEHYTIDYSTIKDVCQKCNNEILGKLDSYFLNFYENNLPLLTIDSESNISICYDYEKLSKWLLKTLYNSERKNGYETLPRKMVRFKDYIRGKDKRSTLFRIYIELLLDVPVEEIKKYSDDVTADDIPTKLNFLRIGNEVISTDLNQKSAEGKIRTIKHFTSSNFMFHIFILDPGQHKDSQFQKLIKDYQEISKVKNVTFLDPSKTNLNLKASNRTIIDILEKAFEGSNPTVDRMSNDQANKK